MSISEQYTDSKLWGLKFCFVFRCVANNYPTEPTNEEAMRAKTFYQQFMFLLPCETCRDSYTDHYKQINIDDYLDNRRKLVEWVEIIYNKTLDHINANNQIQSQNTITQTNQPKNIIPRPPTPHQKVCTTCNKNRKPPNETLFPAANETNSGIGRGYVGGLRKALTESPTQTKYIIIAFYNWIKNPYKLPTKDEATNILKGYNLIKNINIKDYYPDEFVINNTNISLIDNNESILTNPTTSNSIYLKFKSLSI